MKWINVTAHHIARAVGVDYRRYNACNFACLRRARNLSTLGIRKVFDVGAHDGGYGRELREHGYAGAILSFEPLTAPYQRLANIALLDGNWCANPIALGNSSCEGSINVSCHPSSSSLLGMTGAHEKANRQDIPEGGMEGEGQGDAQDVKPGCAPVAVQHRAGVVPLEFARTFSVSNEHST